MNGCAEDHAHAAASQLQIAADRVRLTLDPQTQPSFDHAETAYVAFVEASCAVDAARFAGGSIAGWMRDSCIARRFAARIRALNAFAKCENCYSDSTLTDFELGDLK